MNPGSERLQVVLSKESADQSWGFRLQGGVDFTTPLSVQSVAPGGLAERCGLKAGDAVLSLNGRASDELEHEAAKQIILMAGNEVSLLVQRGAVKVWQPKVTPLSQLRPGEFKQPGDLNGPDPYVQRTSLAADKQEYKPIGTGYNRSARPFPGFGSSGSAPAPGPAPVQAPATQWSAPASQQYAPPPAAVESGFAAAPSNPVHDVSSGMANQSFGADQSSSAPSAAMPSGMRSVRAPVNKPPGERKQESQYMTCKVCGSLCVGVFIRVKGEPMHPECYKCVACGLNLKNQGFYTIQDQLYCSACAQKTAQQQTGGQVTTVYR